MRTIGWILLIFGILSFIGAASKGHSVFGPCFWIALGGFLLYRANNRSEKAISSSSENESIQTDHHVHTKPSPVQNQPDKLESMEDIQKALSLPQREASMCLIFFFGGFVSPSKIDYTSPILAQAANFYGIIYRPNIMIQLTSKYPDADRLIDTVLTIKSHKAKEFLLLTCYDLAKISDNHDAFCLLQNIAYDFGYKKMDLQQLINTYTSI